MKSGQYVAVTPGGTVVIETLADTKQSCIDKLLKEASHMPYEGWSCNKSGRMGFKERGYTIEQVE